MVHEIYKPIRTDDKYFDNIPGRRTRIDRESLAIAVELLTPMVEDFYIDDGKKIHRVMLDMEVERCDDETGTVCIHWLKLHGSERTVWHVEPWWKRAIRRLFKIA